MVLVDDDLRSPKIRRNPSLACKLGTSEYLAGIPGFEAITHEVPDYPGLSVITFGAIKPCVVPGFFARNFQTGPGKWLAYIDKWLLFPILLLAMVLFRKGVWYHIYHICDHSNAPYIFYLYKNEHRSPASMT